MRRRVVSWLILLFVATALPGGCVSTRQAARPEGPAPGIDVRVPILEPTDVGLHSERPAPPPSSYQPLPGSDEYQGQRRWLTLFEINVSPIGTVSPEETP